MSDEQPARAETKACPMCGETILAVAIKCKHCGSEVGPATSPPAHGPPQAYGSPQGYGPPQGDGPAAKPKPQVTLTGLLKATGIAFAALVLLVLLVVVTGHSSTTPDGTSDATAADQPAARPANPQPAAPKLPPEPPPDPAAVKLNDLPKWLAKLAADKAYVRIWEPERREDLKVLLTGVSSTLAVGGTNLATFEALKKRKVFDASMALYMIALRTSSLPDDFMVAFRKLLSNTTGEARLGVWSPEERGRDPHDFAALAAWANRDQPAYIRELLAARAALGWPGWDAEKNGPPARPYLTYEVDALKWLALLAPLTPDERARLTSLKDEAAALRVTASALWQAYKANEVAADERYKGKRLLVSGTVAEVSKDAFDNIVVWLATANAFERVMAKVQDSEKPRAAQLTKGGAVRVLCEGGTMIIGSPTMHDCVIR